MIKLQGTIDKRAEQDLKNILELDGQSVEIGWFDSQGIHEPSGMKYTDLAHYHATGGGGEVIHRDVLAVLEIMYPPREDKDLHELILKWIENPIKKNSDQITKHIGESWQDKLQGLFGSSLLHPTPNNPDPLIDTGDLRDNATYRRYKGK